MMKSTEMLIDANENYEEDAPLVDQAKPGRPEPEHHVLVYRVSVWLMLAVIFFLIGLSLRHKSTLPTNWTRASPTEHLPPRDRLEHHLSCSCYNSTAEEPESDCCRRAVLRIHKGGTFLANHLFEPYDPMIKRNDLGPKSLRLAKKLADFRQVVVMRNFYDAAVSGYLYHQNGYCWYDKLENGTRVPTSFDENINFEGDWTPQAGRDLCQYLREEPTEMGIRVYIDFALSKYYNGIMDYWDERQQRLDEGHEPQIKLVCFEDLSDPSKQVAVWHEMMDWMYPGGHSYQFPLPPPEEEYDGNHATDHDPELRTQLRSVVEQLDRDVFEGTLGTFVEMFGC